MQLYFQHCVQIALTEAGNKLKGLLTWRNVHLSRIRPVHPVGALAAVAVFVLPFGN